jgi:hypothetical protein
MNSYAPYAPQHAVEPELTARRLPRSARFTPATLWARRLSANLFVGGLLLCAFLATRDLNDLRTLAARGQETQAQIVDMRESRGKSTTYRLYYEFHVGGDYVAGRKRVSRAEYEATSIGDTRTVTYLPEDPEDYRVGEVDEERIAEQRDRWLTGTLIGAVLVGGMVALYEWDVQKHLRLLREGIAVVGRVTEAKEVRGKTTTYYLSYRFDLTEAAGFANKITVTKALYDRYAAGIGPAEITVLYDPKNPVVNLPYPAVTAARLDAA